MLKIKHEGTHDGAYLLKYDAYEKSKWVHYGYAFKRVADANNISRNYNDAVFATKEAAELWIRGHGKPCVIVEV